MVNRVAKFVTGENLKKLGGDAEKKKEGEFVLKGQELASKEGFKNVSAIWYRKTQSFDDGLEALEKGRAATEDVRATMQQMKPGVDKDGRLAIIHQDGRSFRPTEFAIGKLGEWAGCGSWFAGQLFPGSDKGDAETLAHVLANGLRKLDQTREFLWRTRKDGSLRALLTDRYAVIDNRWFLESLQRLIPGGRLSHWRGDADTIYGNILIPDTIRQEKDSDYGGMLSIGNSEIGERKVSSIPSIFRAICMNGCIWGAEVGRGIKQVHRGKIDTHALFLVLKDNLEAQIPLLPKGIEKLLGTRSLGWDGVSLKPVFAQAGYYEGKLSKKQMGTVMEGFVEESRVTPDTAKTLFGVINAFTRAGQKMSPADWVKLDTIGGELAEYGTDDWSRLTSRAKSLSKKEVEAAFAD
jgi:hypothetical protein